MMHYRDIENMKIMWKLNTPENKETQTKKVGKLKNNSKAKNKYNYCSFY